MLSDNEKLLEFSRSINRELSDQIEAIDSDIANYKKSETEKIENEVYAECYRTMQTEIALIRRQNISERSAALAKARRELLLKRDEYVSKVFERVRERFLEFMKTPAYDEFLRRRLNEAARQYSFIDPVVTVGEGDKDKLPLFREVLPNVTLKVSDDITHGGFVLHEPGKPYVIDESLFELLEEQKSWFFANSGLRITQI